MKNQIDVNELTLPESWGFITNRNEFNSPVTLVYIQDSFTIPEAQENIVDILHYLHDAYGLSLICTEGQEGEIQYNNGHNSPDQLQNTADKQIKMENSNKTDQPKFPQYKKEPSHALEQLRAGELPGYLYLARTSKIPLDLFGVDIVGLNKEQADALLLCYASYEQYKDHFKAFTKEINRLMNMANNDINKFETDLQILSIGMGDDYDFSMVVTMLWPYEHRDIIHLHDYPNLHRFDQIVMLEDQISPSELKLETAAIPIAIASKLKRPDLSASFKTRLLRPAQPENGSQNSEINQRASNDINTEFPDFVNQLLAEMEQMQKAHLRGNISVIEFNDYILDISAVCELDMELYKNFMLANHLRHLQKQIDVRKLLFEFTQVKDAIYEKLVKTDRDKTLVELKLQLSGLEQLCQCQVLPENYTHFNERYSRPTIKILLANEIIKEHFDPSIYKQLQDAQEKMDATIQNAKQFYRLAQVRAGKLIENTLSRIQSGGVNQAALLCGGFLLNTIQSELESRKISHLVITPTIIGRLHDREKYIEAVKNGRNATGRN